MEINIDNNINNIDNNINNIDNNINNINYIIIDGIILSNSTINLLIRDINIYNKYYDNSFILYYYINTISNYEYTFNNINIEIIKSFIKDNFKRSLLIKCIKNTKNILDKLLYFLEINFNVIEKPETIKIYDNINNENILYVKLF